MLGAIEHKQEGYSSLVAQVFTPFIANSSEVSADNKIKRNKPLPLIIKPKRYNARINLMKCSKRT
jgi:hypothetical protein